MHPPEKFLVAIILVGYAAAELMLFQHGGSLLEMGGVLLVAAALLLYVYLTARRAARAAQASGSCSTCATSSSCAGCASAPRQTGGR